MVPCPANSILSSFVRSYPTLIGLSAWWDIRAVMASLYSTDWWSFFLTYTTLSATHGSFAHQQSPQRKHSCPHTCFSNSSVSSTGLHPSSTIKSATYFTARGTGNVRRVFRAMIWCGLLTIWMRYVAILQLPLSAYASIGSQ